MNPKTVPGIGYLFIYFLILLVLRIDSIYLLPECFNATHKGKYVYMYE